MHEMPNKHPTDVPSNGHDLIMIITEMGQKQAEKQIQIVDLSGDPVSCAWNRNRYGKNLAKRDNSRQRGPSVQLKRKSAERQAKSCKAGSQQRLVSSAN